MGYWLCLKTDFNFIPLSGLGPAPVYSPAYPSRDSGLLAGKKSPTGLPPSSAAAGGTGYMVAGGGEGVRARAAPAVPSLPANFVAAKYTPGTYI